MIPPRLSCSAYSRRCRSCMLRSPASIAGSHKAPTRGAMPGTSSETAAFPESPAAGAVLGASCEDCGGQASVKDASPQPVPPGAPNSTPPPPLPGSLRRSLEGQEAAQ